MGSGLPDPNDDVDACFRFVLDLSRKLGQSNCFSVSRALRHHAWVRAEGEEWLRPMPGQVARCWQQGSRTPAEQDLN